MKRRGEIGDLPDALRRIEEIEDELSQMDGMEEIRERLTDARSDIANAEMARIIDEKYS